ncbi:MAG: hypothetical protein ABL963_16965 [Longimicrobiales bacterium]
MQRQMLVVSDPPQGKVDQQGVAEALGLEVDDTSPKIRFAAPEVLRAGDAARAIPFAHLLRDTGLRVVVVDGDQLAQVPWPRPIASVTFGPAGLEGRFHDTDLLVRYDEPVFAVYCRPPVGYARPSTPSLAAAGSGLAVAEAIDGMTILDLYVDRPGGLERVTIADGVTDFSSLGALRRATAAENVDAVFDECRRRFAQMNVDARLDGVRPRRRFVAGEAGFDMDLRKHYSFGTLLLRHALDSISPDLKDLTHYEYGSRLACAIHSANKS